MKIKQPVSAQTTIEIVPPDGFDIAGDTKITPTTIIEKEDVRLMYFELCSLVSRVNELLAKLKPYIVD